ncbi:MAG: SDR family oxidoreductase [Deltaproteobacteria bacterium]|nr:SDR family oxidoreductase [Deltaproteobacteria bacterium]
MKHILITGATDGIGKVTARELGRPDTTIWVVGRNAAKTTETVRELQSLRPAATYHGLVADLSSPPEVRRLALDAQNQIPQLDVLINNAGAYFQMYEKTPEGFERTFALNHLGYFVLTHHLLPLVRKSPRGRIISVSSEAHRGAKLDFENLQGERHYSGWEAYCRSKLCNILFTKELAKKLAGGSITVNCLHPGFVASKFGHNNQGALAVLLKLSQKIFAINEDRGAQTSVYLATSTDVSGINGDYFASCEAKKPSHIATDSELATKLWTITEQLCAPFLKA